MAAQEELKIVLAELDAQSDRVLNGLRQVRSSAKVKSLQPHPVLVFTPVALALAVAAYLANWLNAGPLS